MERSSAESFAPKLVAGAGAVLLLAGAWAVFAGLRLGSIEKKARIEEGRLKKVHEIMGDAPFRAQLAAAVKTLGEDSVPLPTKLKGLSDKLGVKIDDSITQSETGLPNLGQKEIDAQLKFKDVALARVLDYACHVETDIPGALVVDLVLKPIKDSGDRWEAHLKVAKRIKLAP